MSKSKKNSIVQKVVTSKLEKGLELEDKEPYSDAAHQENAHIERAKDLQECCQSLLAVSVNSFCKKQGKKGELRSQWAV